MSWISNTELMVQKANKRMWFLRRLKYMGAPDMDLIDVYIKHIRSVLELAVPAWHGAITQAERVTIERIQKSASNIILGESYVSYRQSLRTLNLESLQVRRDRLCLNFAKKSEIMLNSKSGLNQICVQRIPDLRSQNFMMLVPNTPDSVKVL